MDELDGHGWYGLSSDGVTHNHHQDILIAQSLWTPAPNSLLREKAVALLGVFIQRLVLTVTRGKRLDGLLTEELLDRAILWFLPLTTYQLGRSRSGITHELGSSSRRAGYDAFHRGRCQYRRRY